jgi:hypothetical protein
MSPFGFSTSIGSLVSDVCNVIVLGSGLNVLVLGLEFSIIVLLFVLFWVSN